MSNKPQFTNTELLALLYTKTNQLDNLNRPELKNITGDLKYILNEFAVRLSIANKTAFKDTLNSLFEEFEYNDLQECFNDLNNDYINYFGEPLYLNYEEFKNDE